MTRDSQQTSANQTSSCEKASHVKMSYNNFVDFEKSSKSCEKLSQQNRVALKLSQCAMLNDIDV